MWAGLHAAWTHVDSSRTPAYEVLNLCVYSLVKAVVNPDRNDERA
ncbi:hypothetical protein [Nocardiopsis quinghaiensis]|nr:hypothetical protein [Nocardiopsis quinghaiensis]